MSTFLFICSTTSNLNNSNLRSASKTKRKNKTDVHNLEITLRIPHFFFGTMRLFETFWIEFFSPKGPPSIFFDVLQHNGCQKIAKGPPFTFFGTVTLFKNLIKNIFWEIFSCLQRVPPSIFLNFLQPAGVSQSPKGPPLNFEP